MTKKQNWSREKREGKNICLNYDLLRLRLLLFRSFFRPQEKKIKYFLSQKRRREENKIVIEIFFRQGRKRHVRNLIVISNREVDSFISEKMSCFSAIKCRENLRAMVCCILGELAGSLHIVTLLWLLQLQQTPLHTYVLTSEARYYAIVSRLAAATTTIIWKYDCCMSPFKVRERESSV